MHRFFIEEKVQPEAQHIVIHNENDVNHIIRALRVTVGEQLEIVDSEGKEFIGEVMSLSEVVTCKLMGEAIVNRESHLIIDLYQGMAKGSKMETIIQKAVELGVHAVYPTMMHRSIVKLDDKSAKKKVERWQKIADEAAKQSKRGIQPQVMDVLQMKSIQNLDYDMILIAYEQEGDLNLKAQLKAFEGRSIAIFIGPEGGFEVEEVDQLKALGAQAISLGKRIVRTETAGMMLISILQYELGDIAD